MGATNVPWELDMAIRRRFERRIYIPLPDKAARATMLGSMIGATPHRITQRDLENLAERTAGFSGSDIANFVKNALYEPVRRC
jgi:vacuolar protein-sorting-associated protein 4